eukprot:TRINITY_DN76463_c0_g1_i1.p1 TRINITY_DN76463_c0_g1~~TRINITY_DN76463_c0_g1_i1.p1  ORF type:complete len:326 (-),score=78.29 TRINITY_DN76463_c0_g1_i1:50-1027(-)
MSEDREYADTVRTARAACERIASHRGPIAVDSEGVALGRDGKLSLIQIALPRYVVIFDVQEIGGESLFGASCGLGQLLKDSNRVKVFFDCRRDCDTLDKQFALRVENIFDLQIADVILRDDDEDEQQRRLFGFLHRGSIRGQPQNYENVVKLRSLHEVLGEYGLSGKEKLSQYAHDQWGERPLSATLREYAFEDAVGIRDLFEKMLQTPGYSEAEGAIKVASRRYADKIRSLAKLPEKKYMDHPLLPLCVVEDFPEVPKAYPTVACPKCLSELPASIFSKVKRKKRDFRCDVCRAIDVQESVQSCWDRDESNCCDYEVYGSDTSF